MHIAHCQICWNCRGLSLSNNHKITPLKDHAEICQQSKEKGQSIFKYFVCDKSEFFILQSLKETLKKYNSISDKLWKTLPTDITKVILGLCKPDVENNRSDVSVNKVCPKRNGDLSSSQPNLKAGLSTPLLTAKQDEKLRAECVITPGGNFTNYFCKLCKYQITSARVMLRHLDTHNNGQAFKCLTCDFSSIFRAKFKQHEQKCKNKKNLLCKHCGEQFVQQKSLDKHLAAKHTDVAAGALKNKFQCEECGFIAKNSAKLKEHKMKHRGQMVHCPHEGCDFRSFYHRSLTKHLSQKHANEKSFMCAECGFQTRHKSSLTKHSLQHRSDKKFKCALCPFTSLTSDQAMIHVNRKHLKEICYSCPICPFETGYPETIKKHIQKHQNLLGLNCSICGDHIESIKNAKKHMTEKHGLMDYKILNENIEKIKSQDFKIIHKENFSMNDPMKYVTVIPNDQTIKDNVNEEILNDDINNVMEVTIEIVKEDAEQVFEVNEPMQKVEPEEMIHLNTNILKGETEQVLEINEPMHKVVPEEVFGMTSDILSTSDQVPRIPPVMLSNESDVRSSQVLLDVGLQGNSTSLAVVHKLFKSQKATQKGRNPMLSAVSNNFEDTDNSLIEDSLFDLMNEFPRPSNLNRCQSASSLMFTSFSPHLIDRPLTPDFFTDSPSAGSFFPNFTSKPFESDTLPLGTLGSFDTPHQEPNPEHVSRMSKGIILTSPTHFINPPMSTRNSSSIMNISDRLMHPSAFSVPPSSVFGTQRTGQKTDEPFSSSDSAFRTLTDEYSRDLQNAVASITDDIDHENVLNDESPFPMDSVI